MNISIVIPTYNRNKILCETLTSVLKETEQCNFKTEIILVDQSLEHDIETTKFLNSIKNNENLIIINPEIPSLPLARNIGINAAQYDIILFLDDDVILQPNFFTNLSNSFKEPKINSVVGRIQIVNSSKDNILLKNNYNIKNKIKNILIKLLGNGKNAIITNQGLILCNLTSTSSQIVDMGMGCCMAFRKKLFDKIGYFDCNYKGNALREETDLFFRIKVNNDLVLYNPKVFLHHIMSNTGGCRNEKNEIYWQTYFYNQCYFYIKNFKYNKLRIFLLLLFDFIDSPIFKFKSFNIGYYKALLILNNKQ